MPRLPGEVTDLAAIRTEDVAIPAATGAVPAYVARPSAGDGPGVVIVHEAFGMVEHVRDVARRFAAAGYVVVAPDLYHRVGAPDPDRMERVMAQMLAVRDADAVADLAACTDWLRQQDDCHGTVGIIGFCSGGRQSLLAACNVEVDATVDCWGGFVSRASPDDETTPERPVPPVDQLERARCPVLLVGGREDTDPSPEIIHTVASRLEAADVDVTVHIAEDAGHAFFADYRPTYREAAAFDLWDIIRSFFDRTLR